MPDEEHDEQHSSWVNPVYMQFMRQRLVALLSDEMTHHHPVSLRDQLSTHSIDPVPIRFGKSTMVFHRLSDLRGNEDGRLHAHLRGRTVSLGTCSLSPAYRQLGQPRLADAAVAARSSITWRFVRESLPVFHYNSIERTFLMGRVD